MRRNNVVFLVGTVVDPKGQVVDIDGVATPVIDMEIESTDPWQPHFPVLVRGRQALELSHFLMASHDQLRVMVLGWLRTRDTGSTIIAERVTAIAPETVRRSAITAFRRQHGRR